MILFALLLPFIFAVELAPNIELTWSVNDNNVTLNIYKNIQSWVAIGFQPIWSNNLPWAYTDIILFDPIKDSQLFVQDYFLGNRFHSLSLDTTQSGSADIQAAYFVQGTNFTNITFSRLLDTGDIYRDVSLNQGPVKVSWAVGRPNTSFNNIFDVYLNGTKIINFISTEICSYLHGCTACVAQTDCTFCNTDLRCYSTADANSGCSNNNTNTCPTPPACLNQMSDAWVPPDFCASVMISNKNYHFRHMESASNGDLLVIDQNSGNLLVMWDENGDGVFQNNEIANLSSGLGLNHEVIIHGDYLFASSESTVYRWRYTPGNRTDLGPYKVLVSGIPSGSGHSTRAIAIQDDYIYVQCGSGSNVDPNDFRSAIMRFNLSQLENASMNWTSGYRFASGLRNEVALRLDNNGRLWGVENGMDNLNRTDLGGFESHDDNPAEEVNLFLEPGKFYGYPYCWTEFSMNSSYGGGVGTQWVEPSFQANYNDTFCKDPNDVVHPVWEMEAHTAPLDMLFYESGDFPSDYIGDIFVSLHGSWDRTIPQGYRVIRLKVQNGLPVGQDVFMRYITEDVESWQFRPVGLKFGPCPQGQCLYVSSDSSGTIVRVSYNGLAATTLPPQTATTTSSTSTSGTISSTSTSGTTSSTSTSSISTGATLTSSTSSTGISTGSSRPASTTGGASTIGWTVTTILILICFTLVFF